jgi:hypothetical protein
LVDLINGSRPSLSFLWVRSREKRRRTPERIKNQINRGVDAASTRCVSLSSSFVSCFSTFFAGPAFSSTRHPFLSLPCQPAIATETPWCKVRRGGQRAEKKRSLAEDANNAVDVSVSGTQVRCVHVGNPVGVSQPINLAQAVETHQGPARQGGYK